MLSKVRPGLDDPLAVFTAPPPNETPDARWAREQREAQARRISDQIDDQLKAERQAKRRKKKPIKVLLLGQSESGKSTTVKNFQLAYAYSSFLAERVAWRAVIHLNLVRSVTQILDILTKELASSPTTLRPFTAPRDVGRSETPFDLDDDGDEVEAPPADPFADGLLTDSHRILLLRLAPLRRVQRDLEHSLGAGASDETFSAPSANAAPWKAGGWRPREFAVTSRSGWKSALSRVRVLGRVSLDSMNARDEARVETASVNGKEETKPSWTAAKIQRRPSVARGKQGVPAYEARNDEEPEVKNAAEVIASCADDMYALWMDGGVRAVLAKKGIRLEEGPGFFLNDVRRIAVRDYQPTDADVVRARLRTMGVQEYRFVFERGAETGQEWQIFDVGGARSLRHAWYPYFDDINAIIFLAPISCFDERLAEDRKVNRLQDSLALWKAVCSTKLLAKVQLILFLNKCDLLAKKLERGVRVSDYVSTYGDRSNDTKTVAKYFRDQFKDYLVRYSPEPRAFYPFLTSVVDTKATAITVATVREGIQQNDLRTAEML